MISSFTFLSAQPTTSSSSTLLPWESTDESKSILSEGASSLLYFSLLLTTPTDLMNQILQLSHVETNFTHQPPQELISLLNFNFREKIPQVMSLLSLDHNLARLHAKISPKMDEEIFWRNYYARIWFLRYKTGIDSPPTEEAIDCLKTEDVIFLPPPPSTTHSSSSASPTGATAAPSSSSSPSPTKVSATSPPAVMTTSTSSTPQSVQIHTRIQATPTPPPLHSAAPPSPSPTNTGGSSSDWDTCDDIKTSTSSAPVVASKGKSTKSVAVATTTTATATVAPPSQSQRLGKEIETMKKAEHERTKRREAEAAALAAEVHPLYPCPLHSLCGYTRLL
jgi:hypothetical protein